MFYSEDEGDHLDRSGNVNLHCACVLRSPSRYSQLYPRTSLRKPNSSQAHNRATAPFHERESVNLNYRDQSFPGLSGLTPEPSIIIQLDTSPRGVFLNPCSYPSQISISHLGGDFFIIYFLVFLISVNYKRVFAGGI